MGENDTILGIGTLFEKRLLKLMVWILPLTRDQFGDFLVDSQKKISSAPLIEDL